MTDHLTPEVRKAISQIAGLAAAQKLDMAEKGRGGPRAKLQRAFEQTDASLPEHRRWQLAELAVKEQLARARLARVKR